MRLRIMYATVGDPSDAELDRYLNAAMKICRRQRCKRPSTMYLQKIFDSWSTLATHRRAENEGRVDNENIPGKHVWRIGKKLRDEIENEWRRYKTGLKIGRPQRVYGWITWLPHGGPFSGRLYRCTGGTRVFSLTH